MKLSDYLKANNLTLEVFGKRIGRSASTVSRIARGIHQPDWDTMEAIKKDTGGTVTPNDFSTDNSCLEADQLQMAAASE